MDKPEKKEILRGYNDYVSDYEHGCDSGWNSAIDDYETWLNEEASEENIEKIIKKDREKHCLLIHSIFAKAISKSILGE